MLESVTETAPVDVAIKFAALVAATVMSPLPEDRVNRFVERLPTVEMAPLPVGLALRLID